MNLVSRFTFLAALLPGVVGYAAEIDATKGCKQNPEIVGACFVVRGRISSKNGSPQMILWPIGTKRLLGVLPSEDEIVPAEVKRLFEGDVEDRFIFGTFEVCPFSPSRPGEMQFVCIESAANVQMVLKRRQGE